MTEPRRKANIDPKVASARSRLGGIARQDSMSDEQRAEWGRNAANARWSAYRAEREAAGLTPTKKAPRPQPSTRALEHWLSVIDREQPDREWASPEERRSAAIRRARQEAARIELQRARGEAGE